VRASGLRTDPVSLPSSFVVDDSEIPFSLGNALLFAGALFGVIASFARPLRSPGAGSPPIPWERWNLSPSGFLFLLWAVAVLILAAPVLGGISTGLFTTDPENPQVPAVGATFFMQVGVIAIVLAAVRFRGWRLSGFLEGGGTSWRASALHGVHLFFRYLPLIWLAGMFWGVLLLGLNELGLGVRTEPQIAAQWIAESESMTFLIAMGIMVVLGAPLSEELLFRGLLFRFLLEKTPARIALVLSSVLFALLHASIHSFLPLCFIGLLLAKVYHDTRDLRTPIFFHLYFNLFSFLNLLLLPMQG